MPLRDNTIHTPVSPPQGPRPAPVRAKDIPASSGPAVIAYSQACCRLDQNACVKPGQKYTLAPTRLRAIRGQTSTTHHGTGGGPLHRQAPCRRRRPVRKLFKPRGAHRDRRRKREMRVNEVIQAVVTSALVHLLLNPRRKETNSRRRPGWRLPQC